MLLIQEFFAACWGITLELAPWLLLGALAGGLLHVCLPAGWLNRQLRGPWGVVRSVALGVPLPLCSCGVIPVGLSLKKGGASSGAAVGFLISTPQTGVDSVLVSATMLGWPFAVFKLAAAAVTGVIGGWLADAVEPTRPNLQLPIAEADRPPRRTVGEVLSYSLMLLRSLWRWLVFGVVVSALITVLLPPDALTGLSAGGGLWAMLLTLAISVPLYVCATASVPIAASLVASGLPTGAALVFLMAGPATNVATIGAVHKTLGRRALAVYLGVIIVGSVLAGWLFEAVLPAEAVTAVLHRHQPTWWAVASAALLLGLIARFAIQEAAAWLRRGHAAADSGEAISVDVSGMTCGGCVSKLKSALSGDARVRRAEVSLSPGRAVVYGDVTRQRVRELVEQAGFSTPG